MNSKNLKKIKNLVGSIPMAGYSSRSRIHRLNTMDAFLKRDDELGFGISGSKLRKYLSLVPYMLSQAPDEAVIVGSPSSNNIVSMSQVAIENGIKPVVFMGGKKPDKLTGNFLLASLLVDPQNIHWLQSDDREIQQEEIQAYLQMRREKKKNPFLIPLGANHPMGLPGSLTLPLDILRNEEEAGLSFDHIFVDAGTGMTAIALILAFTWIGKETALHVVQMAANAERFQMRLNQWQAEFEKFIGSPLPSAPRYFYYRPQNGASFGSVNATVIKTIGKMARHEGIIADPVYSAKLLYEGKNIIKNGGLKGNILFIHSGGGLALLGYVDRLQKYYLLSEKKKG